MSDITKLTRLRDLRIQEEDRGKQELARAQHAVAEADRAIAQLQEQRRDLESALQEIHGESVGQVRTLRLLVEGVDQGILNAQDERARAVALVAIRVEELAEARRRRDSLERIIIPRQEQIRVMQRLAEQKLDDEAALVRFRAGGRTGS